MDSRARQIYCEQREWFSVRAARSKRFPPRRRLQPDWSDDTVFNVGCRSPRWLCFAPWTSTLGLEHLKAGSQAPESGMAGHLRRNWSDDMLPWSNIKTGQGWKMTKLQRDEYLKNGYVSYPGLLDAGELKTLLAEIDRISDGNTLASHDKTRLEMEPQQKPDGRLVRRIYEPCTHYAAFRDLSETPKLLDAGREPGGARHPVPLQQDQHEAAGDWLGSRVASGSLLLPADQLLLFGGFNLSG